MTRVAWAAVGVSILLATAGCGSHRRHVGLPSRDITPNGIGMDGEVSAGVDPRDPSLLLAGSIGKNDEAMRFYGSTDGGTTWRGGILAPLAIDACYADPAVAIAPRGLEYYAYLRLPCTEDAPQLFVRTRQGGAGAWSPPHAVDHPVSPATQDRPAIAVDTNPKSPHDGRVWVAWAEYAHDRWDGAFVAYSDDRGLSWSRAQRLKDAGYEPTLAVAPDGSLIEASGDVPDEAVFISSPGAGGFQDKFDSTASRTNWCSDTHFLPAQPHRRVCATPSIAIDQDRSAVYVAWSGDTRAGTRSVFVRRFSLAQLRDGRITHALPAPIDASEIGRADEFFPTAAVDQSTGSVWVCFYETQGAARRLTRFTCRVSRDGGRAWSAIPAASRPSNEASPFAPHFGYGDYEDVVAADGVAHPFWTAEASFLLSDDIFTATLVQP